MNYTTTIPEIKPGRILMALQKLENICGRLEQATERRLARQAHLRQIKEFAEDGTIAMVWSGRDCDGVRYSNEVHIVEATVAAVTASAEHTYAWADGPCGYRLERPSVANGLSYTSRDLVMEAFEDGHQHVIYS